MVGAGLLGLAGTVALLTDSGPKKGGDRRDKLVSNLLTDSDPRGMGVDALAQRIRENEETIRKLTSQLQAVKPPERGNADLDALRREGETQMQALRVEQEAMRMKIEDLAKGKPDKGPSIPDLPLPEVRIDPSRKPPLPAAPPPTPAPAAPPPLRDIFKTPPAAAPAGAPAPKPAGRAMEIRVVTAAPAPGNAKAAPGASARDAMTVPAGSIIRAVFLSGMDAPTGHQARRDPFPALARIKREAILPNLFTADISECFLILSGYGDLGSERAYLRTEAISCVRKDGGSIEVPVDGYAVGEDGKAGVRGRLVSKQGAALANAMAASFIQGFAQVFTQVPVTTISTNPGTSQPYQQALSPQSLQNAAIAGTGKSLDRLADYYMDMAEDMFPVIEIDAGRAVEVILNKGASLRMADQTRGRR
jgi:conjugal transfer pilus assembly protein TraB